MLRRDFLMATSVVAASAIAAGGGGGSRARKLAMFNHVSLDGYFTDAKGDMSWAHTRDEEWQRFTHENAGGEAELVFGRKTYQMMAGFWPTPQARQTMPEVAASMNRMRKYVFSRSLHKLDWENSALVKGDLASEVRRLKSQPGPGLLIMGSGEIVSQLTAAGLIDEYQLVTVPLVIGSGRSLFEGVTTRPRLALTRSRTFQNGNVVSWYSLHSESGAARRRRGSRRVSRSESVPVC
jgi:dihydrofolate reductase